MAHRWGEKTKFHNQDSMWTSYSDLFLGLSVIFLLLYVTASLRQGTDGIRQHIDNQQLSRENEDLKQQLKVYNSLKQNYLDTEASQDEQKTYQMLMDKLNLLKDDANTEKTKLEQAAEENANKEKALNQYQQTIRNIINANLLSKSRIKNRDVLITKNEDTIEGQSKEISEQQTLLNQKKSEIEQGQSKIQSLNTELEKKLKQLQRAYKQNKLTETIYQKRQQALKDEIDKKVAVLNTKNQKAQEDLNALSAKYQAAQGDLSRTKVDLEKARENLNARKKLAEAIRSKFKENGVSAEVDGKTGDVLLSFNGEYFDTGAAQLKPGMKKVLERAMPAYASSLFADPKIADRIENVEIVGFASPTYNGKYIDPSKLSEKDREAVNFNLDLSYSRARGIFDHVLTKMQFAHKQRLLTLAKVTGRSFLADKKDRGLASDSISDFCKVNDCAKQQTVVIKFKLKD